MLPLATKAALMSAVSVVLIGCDRPAPPTDVKTTRYNIHVETVRGHEYVIATPSGGGGVSTVHAEHCQCKGGE